MKKLFLIWSLLSSSFCAYAQKSIDSVYKKQQLSKTDVEVLFSYYTQDGNHSAITGGTGTEQLHVYAPEFSISHQSDSLNAYRLDGGVDIITSASADNIDFVKSSASRIDARTHISLGYARKLKTSNTHFGVGSGFSIESAYTSFPESIYVDHTNKANSRTISAAVQCYFDDLRWGRLDPDYHHVVSLVYPAELRGVKWFNNYGRNSYNLSLAFSQVINQRMILALFPDIAYQHGLLCTPYHRVYFLNSTEKVETLPSERIKFPLGAQLNIFAGSNVIIRSYYRFYADNWGIRAHTLQLETAIKLGPLMTITPLGRYYTQTAAKYFEPYAMHDINEAFFTSDYDLSKFSSFDLGVNVRYAPHAKLWKNYFFNDIALRYDYYKRSDGLHAHMLSTVFNINHAKMVSK